MSVKFAELAEKYLEHHSRPHKRTWRDDERRLEREILPALGLISVNKIKAEHISSIHIAISKRAPYEANRVLELLSSIFGFGIRWQLCKTNPASCIKKNDEEKRDRFLNRDEVGRLLTALQKERSVYIRTAMLLYLLTGLRRMELLSAKWEHVDFELKQLRIPKTKAKRPHYQPLTDEAIQVLLELPKRSEYISPGRNPERHRTRVSRAWARIRKEADIEDVRLHDLRRTLGSWLAQQGCSLHLIGRALNQTTQSVTAGYARFAQADVHQALSVFSSQLEAINKATK